MILDVGCGYDFHGHVNVDLYPSQTIHRDKPISFELVPNFVRADCHNLPFRDNSFEQVFSRHLLEHRGVRLVDTCREMLRVAHGKVTIIVPNLFRASKFNIQHDKVFTWSTFHILFRNFRHEIHNHGFDWVHLYIPRPIKLKTILRSKTFWGKRNPIHFFPCPIPTEIKVEVFKKVGYIH